MDGLNRAVRPSDANLLETAMANSPSTTPDTTFPKSGSTTPSSASPATPATGGSGSRPAAAVAADAAIDQAADLKDEWTESVRTAVREHPLAAIGTALALGVLLAKLTSNNDR